MYSDKFSKTLKDHLNTLNLNTSRVFNIVAIILIPLFALTRLDYLLKPDRIYSFILIRILQTLFCLILLALSYVKKLRNYGAHLSFLSMMVVGIGFAVMIRILGADGPYYAGLNLIYLGFLLTPWGGKSTFMACFTVYSFYFVPVLLYDIQTIPYAMLINNNIFQIFNIVVACTVNHYQYKRRERSLFNQHTITRQADELRQTQEEKIEFIATLSHDLKSPLTVLAGNVDLLQTILPTDLKTKRHIKFMQSSINQSFIFIQKLIDIALIEKREDKPDLIFMDYTDFIKFHAEFFKEEALKRDIEYILEFEEDPVIIHFDKFWIERILSNIVMNAFKFSKENIESSKSVTIKTFKDDEYVYTEISDTGLGIKKEHLERIFEKRYQTNEGNLTGGVGLGLFIVKKKLELLGGNISVLSKYGSGSTFKIAIPLAPNQDMSVDKISFEGANRRTDNNERRDKIDRRFEKRFEDLKNNIDIAQGISTIEFNETEYENINPDKSTILVCDDTPAQLNLIVEILKDDYNLIFARDGLKGLSQVEQYKDKISLIISDMRMPNMSGLEFCTAFFSNPDNKHIPFVFLTAYGNEEEQLEGIKTGATDYLTKPIKALILREKITHWISKRNDEISLLGLSERLRARNNDLKKLQDIVFHEIKNPLGVVQRNVSIMGKYKNKYFDSISDEGGEKYAKSLKTMNNSLSSIVSIIGRIANTDLEGLLFQPVSIQAIIEDIEDQTKHLFKDIEFKVECRFKPEKFFIKCDKIKICQVFVNLIRNAVESIDGNSDGLVIVEIVKGYKKINFIIKDNGQGITEQVLGKIFEFRFSTKGDRGKGIGLWFSKNIIIAHDGDMTVKSEVGKGTEFNITLLKA